MLEKAITRLLPQERIRQAVAPAVIGAAFLALEQIEIILPEAILAQLDKVI